MKIKSWGEFYEYETDVPHMLNWATTHSLMISELMQYDRILEVGTGTGLMSGILSRYCQTVISLDNCEPVLESARRSVDRIASAVTFVGGDAFDMPFADQSFDAAFSQGLFEHFSDEDILRLAREQLRVAKSSYISVPSIFYPHVGRLGPGLVGNERLKTVGFWRDIFSEFDIKLATYYSDHKILTFAGMSLPWPAQVLLKLESKQLESWQPVAA
jgi:SAM-dependent methyltransferase